NVPYGLLASIARRKSPGGEDRWRNIRTRNTSKSELWTGSATCSSRRTGRRIEPAEFLPAESTSGRLIRLLATEGQRRLSWAGILRGNYSKHLVARSMGFKQRTHILWVSTRRTPPLSRLSLSFSNLSNE